MNERYIKWWTAYLSREFGNADVRRRAGIAARFFRLHSAAIRRTRISISSLRNRSLTSMAAKSFVYCFRTRSISKVFTTRRSIRQDRMRGAQRLRKRDRARRVRFRAPRRFMSPRWGLRRESRRLSRFRTSPAGILMAEVGSSHQLERLTFDISSFFDGYHDDNIYFNSPYEYLPNMRRPWGLNHRHHHRHGRMG